MSVCYEQADDAVNAMARDVLEVYHRDDLLMGAGPKAEYVRLCILMAFSADDDEPAVKCHGYPAQAVISIIPLKQRVDKRADAEIIIDRKNWDDLTDPQQRALHDFDFGGFRSVARRHGEHAPEVILARKFEEDFGQDVLGRAQLFHAGR